MKKLLVIILTIAILTILAIYLCQQPTKQKIPQPQSTTFKTAKKILYVDSYHKEYSGRIPKERALLEHIKNKNIEVKTVFFDAKHIKNPDTLKAKALSFKKIIEDWQPDIIIAMDDAASKYLITPHYKNTEIPVVFAGVNWTAKPYGYPCKNITGQIEVELIKELFEEITKYTKGHRIGFLSANTPTNKKALQHYRDIFGIKFKKTELLDDFESWKQAYTSMQDEVDIIFLRNYSGISSWNEAEVKEHIALNTKIPTVTTLSNMHHYALLSYCKLDSEVGEYAIITALKILNGTPPSDIPISYNKKVKVYLNMDLAKKLKIKFPFDLMQRAYMVYEDSKKLLFINSYHRGHQFSDDIEKGLFNSLSIRRNTDGSLDTSHSHFDIKTFYMDSKRNPQESIIKQAALNAKKLIEDWQPDIIVASDDNASKYLIAPYFKNSSIPIVFCGINWDASAYGFPTKNITGILEVPSIIKPLTLVKDFTTSDRIGIIGTDIKKSKIDVEQIQKLIPISESDIHLVSTFSEWETAYNKLQETVGCVMWLNHANIKNWNTELAETVIMENTKIPSIAFCVHHIKYALLGHIKIGQEQGWRASRIVKMIQQGISPEDIPIEKNNKWKLLINTKMAKILKIKFPMSALDEAELVE